MAQPTISASLDKTTYNPGEVMTLTVEYGQALMMMGPGAMLTISIDPPVQPAGDGD